MEITYYPKQKTILEKGLSISFLFHIFVIVFIVLEAQFFSTEKIDFSTAVRVDLVGLPDKIDNTPQPLPEAASTTEESATEKTPEIVETKVDTADAVQDKKVLPDKLTEKKVDPEAISFDKKDVKKQQSALDKIKSLQAIEKLKNEVQAAKPALVKGSVLSPGASLSGLNKLQHSGFIQQIDKHIKSNWALPQWLTNKNYKAQVIVKFDENGIVTSKQLVKSSGNPAYDEVALETIDRSSPFPKPPEKFSAIFKFDGILVGFPE